jgi:hypothetical protein
MPIVKSVYLRYIQFNPSSTEDYIDFLIRHDLLEDAFDLYIQIIDDSGYVSPNPERTKFSLRMELCKFIALKPDRC